jgi:hypothetical protein
MKYGIMFQKSDQSFVKTSMFTDKLIGSNKRRIEMSAKAGIALRGMPRGRRGAS